jgi:hypothetical protein
MKTIIKNLAKTFLLGIVLVGCSPSSTPPSTAAACNNVNTDFQLLYNNTLISNVIFDNYVNMDLLTHEYNFTVSANKTVCSVGYQGNAALFAAGKPYTIEIYNNTTSSVVYTGPHLFNSVATDYQPITPTNLIAGNSYTIKRILPPSGYLANLANTTGRILRFNAAPVPYPVNQGVLTISASNFYGAGGPVVNFGIPYIDIVFQ